MISRYAQSFRRILPALIVAALAGSTVQAQHECKFFGEEAANHFENDLKRARSCKEAADLFDECRWGSSADARFGAVVIEKCKREYLDKLTPAQKQVHDDRIQLCTYEYEHQQGTLYISETVSCHISVAVEFASHPAKAATPLPSASFDCTRAASPLEKAICSDKALGRADLVLSRVYSGDLKSAKGTERAALIESERKWLKDIPAQCGLLPDSHSGEVLACLRDQFESRFTLLDECAVGGEFEECLGSTAEDR